MRTTVATLTLTTLLYIGCGTNDGQENASPVETDPTEEQILESTNGSSDHKLLRAKGFDDLKAMSAPDKKVYYAAVDTLNRGNVAETIEMLKPLVERNRPNAIYLTGICYQFYSTLHDAQKAKTLMEIAIPGLKKLEQMGDANAIYYLGCKNLRAKQTAEGQARLKRIIPGFEMVAVNGSRDHSAVAKARLGDLHYFGWGTELDRKKGLKWHLKSAQDGNLHAHYMIGAIYKEGKFVKRNWGLAESYLKVAAKKNYAPAMIHLGWELTKSKSASDREKGITMLVQAKLLGEPQASGLIASAMKTQSGAAGSSTNRKTNSQPLGPPRNQQELKSFAKRIARAVGKTIMDAIGGGQDLVVNLQGVDYDSLLKQYEIDIMVSFNGKIFRTDNYRVAGRITVNADGSNAKFARTACNENYKEWEGLVTGLKITAAVAEVINESNKK